ncbi:MAG: STAS domain-containing protein [Burkholderiales bacterium]|nr:STAS domain-containing protein [Burkholderiales bacterium]
MSALPGDEVLRIEGNLSYETIPAVLAETAQFAARPDLPPNIRIDFSGVTGVDSSAVALLLEWRRMALARGKTLVFENLPANLLALAQLYGVAELIQPDPA